MVIVLSLFLFTATSCEQEWPDDLCTCSQGGSIEGWDDGGDSDIHQKDSTAGFEIRVDQWNGMQNQNITL